MSIRPSTVYRRVKRDKFDTDGAGEYGPVNAKREGHQRVIEDFIDAGQLRRAPLVSGREALASHQLIKAIELSSRSGGVVDIKH